MDMMSMLMNAVVTDMDGDKIGDVIALHVVAGKLMLTIFTDFGDYETDDPDDGEAVDKDDERELDKTKETPKPTLLRAVGGTGG